MKATGIVRHIDVCVITGQEPMNRITTGFFNDFCPKFSSENLEFCRLN